MQTQLKRYQQRLNQQLALSLEGQQNQQSIPQRLMDAMHYATLNHGKRLRPALIYAVGEALEIPLEKLDTPACAIELIHSYSLVHDDLPAMDNDDLRRGQPTCHIQYDEATAILVGDAQQTLAFEILSVDTRITAKDRVRLIQQLSRAAGIAGMIGGQVIDIQSESKQVDLTTLERLHSMKTGALIECALLMGAAQAPNFSSLEAPLKELGKRIGLAFQVHDDILDIEGDTQTLGKPQGSDQAAGKSTFPALLGLQAAKEYRDRLIDESLALLDTLSLESDFLRQLIHYIAQRSH